MAQTKKKKAFKATPATTRRSKGDLVKTIAAGTDLPAAKVKDVLEVLTATMAADLGKKGGEFYTPRCVVKVLVKMLEPYRGRVYDPCCGSSGMFVQSIAFIRAHASGNGNGGKARGDISVYGQESNYTTWRLANRAVEPAQVIEELIGLAREMREASARGDVLGLSDDELAFYDALGVNDSAVQVLGDKTLCDIARELVATVRSNVTIDWTLRENVRANLRRLVKRVLRKHGYPPDKQESATQTVLEQAEVLSTGWAT